MVQGRGLDQVWHDRPAYLLGRHLASVLPLAQARHLLMPDLGDDRRGLLRRMDTECAQEPVQPMDHGAGRLEAQQQIPIHGEAE
jgi:hypothetical protein